MEKEDFVNHIKKFLPSNSIVNFKKSNNNIIKVKKRLFTLDINIHPAFLKADKNLIQDIVNFINQDKSKDLKESKNRISKFFNENYIPQKIKIKNKFKYKNIQFNFQDIIANLKNVYTNINFNDLKITWGKNYKNRRRSIRFGSFDKKNNLIRIHPSLDNINIPDFFIRSIIYHEITHFIVFTLYKKSQPHSKIFRSILKMLDPDYETSRIWEKNNKYIFFNRTNFNIFI